MALAVLGLVVSGCMGRETLSAEQEAPPMRGDLDAFTSCPSWNGRVIPCKPDAENRVVRVEVEPLVPPGWICVSDWSEQMDPESTMWWRLWIKFPADDSEPGIRQFGLEFGMDDEGREVAGVLGIDSEPTSPLVTWRGNASRGFIAAPVELHNLNILYTAFLHPAGLGVNVTGFEAQVSEVFWSRSQAGRDSWSYWNVTLALWSNGKAYNFHNEEVPFRPGAALHSNPGYAGASHQWYPGLWPPGGFTASGQGFFVEARWPWFEAVSGYLLAESYPTGLALAAADCGAAMRGPRLS